jgi:hypothetical protein
MTVPPPLNEPLPPPTSSMTKTITLIAISAIVAGIFPAVGLAIAIAAVGGYVIAGNDGDGGPQETIVQVPPQRGVSGTLAVGENSSMLDLHGLAQLKGRQVYQVWVAKDQSLRPSSNFVPDKNGRAMTAVDGQLDPGTRVMLTKESGPGHTTPTPPILLSATVQ